MDQEKPDEKGKRPFDSKENEENKGKSPKSPKSDQPRSTERKKSKKSKRKYSTEREEPDDSDGSLSDHSRRKSRKSRHYHHEKRRRRSRSSQDNRQRSRKNAKEQNGESEKEQQNGKEKRNREKEKYHQESKRRNSESSSSLSKEGEDHGIRFIVDKVGQDQTKGNYDSKHSKDDRQSKGRSPFNGRNSSYSLSESRIRYNYIDEERKRRQSGNQILFDKKKQMINEAIREDNSEEGETKDSRSLHDEVVGVNKMETTEASAEKTEKKVASDSESSDDSQKRQKNFMNRYFMDEEDMRKSTKVCFRCKKPGHFERNCLEIFQKSRCYFCQKTHASRECNSAVCYNCGVIGHMRSECKANPSKKCFHCNKRGHSQEECGSLLPRIKLNKLTGQLEDDVIFTNKEMVYIKCITCRDSDHVRCDMKRFEEGRELDYQRLCRSIVNDGLYQEEPLPNFHV